MHIKILSDQPVSKNFAAGDIAIACAYPSSTVLSNGNIACLYRQGAGKHSQDGILVLQTSSDQGVSWSQPQIVFDGRYLQPRITVVSGGICQTDMGTLLATFSLVEDLDPDVYMFSEEGMALKWQICASRSEDEGRTWTHPVIIDTSSFTSLAAIATKPLFLSNGEIFIPVEVQTSFGPNGTAATFSKDDGQTFEPLINCAADPNGKLNLCDARFTILNDGRLLMLLWTFLQDTEETIEVHSSFSSDCGKTWTKPKGVGIFGQVTVPLALPSGTMIAASNFRHMPEGIRLYYSPDSGKTWDSDHPVQMWDMWKRLILGQPIAVKAFQVKKESVWEALDQFTFGTPDLLYLKDGSILLTYWGTIDSIIHVRACRFLCDNSRG
jgi:hypothetical protein